MYLQRLRNEVARFVRTERSERAWAFRRTVSMLAGATLLASALCAQSKPKLMPVWDASDETSTASIDHRPWQETLTAYLRVRESGANRFDYAGLKASRTDALKLSDYLDHLQGLDPRTYSRAEQKAYWINFYNALTVKIILGAYPVESIREIRNNWLAGLIFPGPWDDVHAQVAGMDVTLNHIESGILRPSGMTTEFITP